MSKEKKFALKVNEILGQYIAIHDDMLKTSLRRIIPIPGIFQAIDYDSHSKDLSGLENQLMEIVAALTLMRKHRDEEEVDEEFINTLDNYSSALVETIRRLKLVCEKLYRKSQGDSGYDRNTYNRDMEDYMISIDRYMALGDRLNALYSRTK